MHQQPSQVAFHTPFWLAHYISKYKPVPDTEVQMRFVIDAARRNVEQGTGGPFAAGVFEQETGELVALGVNQVRSQGLSILHAEIEALTLAERTLGNYDLANDPDKSYGLVCLAEPCAMCLGAVPWSGVRNLFCGATTEDVEALGFDEGARPSNWQKELEKRGIRVVTGVCREEANAVLGNYREAGGEIYNSRIQEGE